MAEEKKVPKWVRTGNPADANRPKENLESQQEEPQEQAEVIPPPVSEDVRQENQRQHIPWTPPSISEEEHKRQIEEAAAKPMAVSEGFVPPDRKIVAPAPPPEPAPLDPQAEQAFRLREFWNRSLIENPEGMPVGAIEVSEVTRETTIEDGVEITKVNLNRGGYFAGPDSSQQPHAVILHQGKHTTLLARIAPGQDDFPSVGSKVA